MIQLPKLLLLLFSLLGYGSLMAQREPVRSIYDALAFTHNPAMVAPGDYLEWGAVHRQQWIGFDGAPQTSFAYFQMPITKLNMSVGASLMHDVSGPITENDVRLSYSYKLQVGYKGQISLGLQARLAQLQFDGDNVVTGVTGDPLLSSTWSSQITPNFSFGAFYTSDVRMYGYYRTAFFAGVAINEMFPNKYSNKDNLDRFVNRTIGANAIFGARFALEAGFLEPSLWVQYTAPNLINTTANVFFESEERFWSGLSFSSDYTIGFQGGFYISEGFFEKGHLRVGVMGTYNIGPLTAQKGIGMEFILGYRFYMD